MSQPFSWLRGWRPSVENVKVWFGHLCWMSPPPPKFLGSTPFFPITTIFYSYQKSVQALPWVAVPGRSCHLCPGFLQQPPVCFPCLSQSGLLLPLPPMAARGISKNTHFSMPSYCFNSSIGFPRSSNIDVPTP